MNEFNKKIIEKLEELDIEYNDLKHYEICFTHPSYSSENNINYSNQRQEFLGDAIFGYITSEFLYKNFPKCDEGELTKRKINLVSKDAMNLYSSQLNLIDILRMSKGESNNGRKNKNTIEDLFESFIAAIYLDAGINEVNKFFENHIKKHFKNQLNISLEDPKSKLQELLQSQRKNDIIYKIIWEKGPEHDKIFKSAIFVNNIKYGDGIGKTKQESEKNAAKNALDKLLI